MKLFLDTANLEQIREAHSWGILEGVTTNPTLAAKEGVDFKSNVRAIAEVVEGPISAEVISLNRTEMVSEARELATIAPNVVIKIPITPEGLAATKQLASEGIRVNMTLIFSLNQALLAAMAGAAFVSPFVGRLDDIGEEGTDLLADIIEAYANYGIDTEVIAASVRHPRHVAQAALIGVHIATIPFDVLKKMAQHPLTDKGIAQFLADWERLQERLAADAALARES